MPPPPLANYRKRFLHNREGCRHRNNRLLEYCSPLKSFVRFQLSRDGSTRISQRDERSPRALR